MVSEPLISARDISKIYRIWDRPNARLAALGWQMAAGVAPTGGSLHAALQYRATRCYRDFHALHGLSLEVHQGQSIGIIGRNGSGKSTLLQIIAGTLTPSSGTIAVRGRVAALLELGSGFNPDFTGKENVLLNAAVLGLSREKIEARYEAIVAFAEIGDFIDQPIKTYSSGMVLRLAFAVAAHVDPDVLIIDEALGVGDARFQLKCARAIDRFVEQGVALLFVSHDASMVKRLCQRAILLEHGHVVYAGKPNDVVNLYSKLIADGGSIEALATDVAALRATEGAAVSTASPLMDSQARPAAAVVPSQLLPSGPAPVDDIAALGPKLKALETILHAHPESAVLARQVEKLLADERQHLQISGQEFSYGGELGRIHEIAVADAAGQTRTWFSSGEAVKVRMVVEAHEHLHEPIFALTIKNSAGVEIYGTNTLFSRQPAAPIAAGEWRAVTFSFDLNLMPGAYFLSFGFTHFLGDNLVVIHRRYDAIKIDVHAVDRSFGIANLKATIQSQAVPGAGPDDAGSSK